MCIDKKHTKKEYIEALRVYLEFNLNLEPYIVNKLLASIKKKIKNKKIILKYHKNEIYFVFYYILNYLKSIRYKFIELKNLRLLQLIKLVLQIITNDKSQSSIFVQNIIKLTRIDYILLNIHINLKHRSCFFIKSYL